MKKRHIQLNGRIYSENDLDQLFRHEKAPDWWENQIVAFLKEWFDENDYVVVHTSGSTGQPKSIRLSKELMSYSAHTTNTFFFLDASKTALLCLPVSYIAGKMMIVRALEGGFNLLAVQPTANPFLEIKQHLDFAAITPYQLHHSMNTIEQLKVGDVIVGGGSIDARMLVLMQNASTRYFETFGMTETASHIALRLVVGDAKSEFFKVLKGYSVSTDQRGCLRIDAKVLNEPVQSNDLVELKNDNEFRWLGRIDRVISTGGVKVFPEQIEKRIDNLIPYEFFVASIPDLELGQKVVLCLQSHEIGLGAKEEMMRSMRLVLSKFELPKEILCIPHFVYSSSNKLLRNETLLSAEGV